jgi:hypothetical protein
MKNNKENNQENNHIKGCIYGTPVKIKTSILPDTTLLVIEMNNTKNKIEGIGIIKNNLMPENRKYIVIITTIDLYTNQILESTKTILQPTKKKY